MLNTKLGISAGLILLAASSLGCQHTGHGAHEDTVSGYYEGDWYGPNPDRPLGELTCTIERRDGTHWDATFFASFGGFGEYEVAMEGKREDGRVVFGGSIDLGETSGGVFNWDGEVEGDEFRGAYTSKAINGTFRMRRAPAPAE